MHGKNTIQCCTLAGPRVRSVMGGTKGGHVLVTPLASKLFGRAVLVNRGWVPTEWRADPAMRAAGQPTGQARLTQTCTSRAHP